MDHLLPLSAESIDFGFTTCPDLGNSCSKLDIVSLEDKALGVHKSSSKLPHKLIEPPLPSTSSSTPRKVKDPTLAWEAFYPKGSINPSNSIPGGFGFYLSGPPRFSKALSDGRQEVVLSYRMMLQKGWQGALGGKLPGVFGGEGDLSYHCTGGRQRDRCRCFNLRPMWRKNAQGELYVYLPPMEQNKTKLLAVPPESKENSDYGISIGQGSFAFADAIGNWMAVSFRVKLNDVGVENGEMQLWINGQSVITVSGLTLRTSDAGKIKGMHFQTFFGGHTDEWASPADQRAWFADVSAVIVRE